MKVVILAGGRGTRLSEETGIKPKPMIEIGNKPIIWHIMKIYSHYGYNEFIVCCGYKGYMLKEYFANYFLHEADVTIDLSKNKVDVHVAKAEPWKITLVDTGLETMTGGRIKRIESYIGNETFFLTYGDGLTDVNISKLVDFHKRGRKLSTLTAVQTIGRFGAISIDSSNSVSTFIEKPRGDNVWINGGFFVLEPGIFSYLKDDTTIWEKEPLENLAKDGLLQAFKHNGFWKPMDHLRDKIELDAMWNSNQAPWKIW
jgi:glucose-1-phosphate cytidylyltransferase